MAANPEDRFYERMYASYLSTQAVPEHRSLTQDVDARGPYLSKLIRDHFPEDRNAAICDVGCGYGALLVWAKSLGYENLRGFDISPSQVEAAHSLGLNFVTNESLGQGLDRLKDASLDVVIAYDVLEHIPKHALLDSVEQIFRILRPGGRFIFHVPNGEGLFPGAVFFGDLTHQSCFTRRSATQLMTVAGFRTTRVFEDTPVVHSAKSAVRWGLWKAFRSVARLAFASETGDLSSNVVFTQNMLVVSDK